MSEELDDKASGDVMSDPKITTPDPEPAPVKVPDVELIVDGFGFMPKSPETSRSNLKPPKLSKGLKSTQSPEGFSSPCMSSTNIDIVRRFTWKTKNRMTVQVLQSIGRIFDLYYYTSTNKFLHIFCAHAITSILNDHI